MRKRLKVIFGFDSGISGGKFYQAFIILFLFPTTTEFQHFLWCLFLELTCLEGLTLLRQIYLILSDLMNITLFFSFQQDRRSLSLPHSGTFFNFSIQVISVELSQSFPPKCEPKPMLFCFSNTAKIIKVLPSWIQFLIYYQEMFTIEVQIIWRQSDYI